MKIEEIIQLIAENPGQAVAELQNGRRKATPEIDKFKTQLDPELHEIVINKIKYPDKWVKVDRSEQPTENTIEVTEGKNGDGTFKLEPIARIALAIQEIIVKRAVAFTFGNAPKLNAEPKDGTKEKDVLDSINRVNFDNKIRTLNRRVASILYSATEVAELWYPVDQGGKENRYGFESPFKLRVALFNPMNGDKLYPFFDDNGDMQAFSRQYQIQEKDNQKKTYFETYTATEHYIWQQGAGNDWTLLEGYPKKNTIGKIPVVYARQDNVEWASVQGLIERLEELLSRFADTNDYHASPKIVVKGEIIGWSKKGESGSIIEMDPQGSAEYLTWSQAPESVKLEIDTLLRFIYTLTQTPDISWESVKGLGNISGRALRLLFLDAHLKVQDKTEIFDDYLQRRLSIQQAFLAEMNKKDAQYAAAAKSLQIEPEIEPYMLRDEESEIDEISTAVGGKAFCSRETAIRRLGWVKDAAEELNTLEEEENAANFNDITEPTV